MEAQRVRVPIFRPGVFLQRDVEHVTFFIGGEAQGVPMWPDTASASQECVHYDDGTSRCTKLDRWPYPKVALGLAGTTWLGVSTPLGPSTAATLSGQVSSSPAQRASWRGSLALTWTPGWAGDRRTSPSR